MVEGNRTRALCKVEQVCLKKENEGSRHISQNSTHFTFMLLLCIHILYTYIFFFRKVGICYVRCGWKERCFIFSLPSVTTYSRVNIFYQNIVHHRVSLEAKRQSDRTCRNGQLGLLVPCRFVNGPSTLPYVVLDKQPIPGESSINMEH